MIELLCTFCFTPVMAIFCLCTLPPSLHLLSNHGIYTVSNVFQTIHLVCTSVREQLTANSYGHVDFGFTGNGPTT